MKIYKIAILTLMVLLPSFVNAQGDCSSFFKYRRPEAPYEYNSQSKSAMCVTGNTYEFILPLTKGKDYRLKFFAAAVYNNKLSFKIIDQSTHEVVLELPGGVGMYEDAKAGTCVLQNYMDEETDKMVHPFFDFFPVTSTTLKIIIDVEALAQSTTDNSSQKAPKKQNRGCVTVVVLDKPSTNSSFH